MTVVAAPEIRAEGVCTAATVIGCAFVNIRAGRHRAIIIGTTVELSVTTITIIAGTFIYIRAGRRRAIIIGATVKLCVTAATIIGETFVYVCTILTVTFVAGVTRTTRCIA